MEEYHIQIASQKPLRTPAKLAVISLRFYKFLYELYKDFIKLFKSPVAGFLIHLNSKKAFRVRYYH